MAIKIGRWDCSQCGFKGNLGPEKSCEKCGAPRPQNVKFYLADDSEIVKNTSKIQEAKSGADWVCSFCSGHNKAIDNICKTCGNDRDVLDGDKSLEEKIHLYNQKQEKKKPKKKRTKKKRTKKKRTKKKRTQVKLGKGTKKVLIGLVSFFILFAILAQFSSDIEVTATGFKWERSIEIEENTKIIKDGWEIPKDGKEIESYKAIHHHKQLEDGTETRTRTIQKQVGTEKVKIGEKDLGNGYFEDIYEEKPVYEDIEETYTATKYKKIPVYKTKYKYSVFEWKDAGTLNAKDNKKPAYWPGKDKLADKNKFRVKNKEAKYFLIVKGDDETYTEEIKFELWEEIKMGDVLIAEKSSIFGTFYGLKLNN